MASRQSLGVLQKKKDDKSRQLISTVWENRKIITWDGARIISSAEVDVAFTAVDWEDEFQVPGAGIGVIII